MLQNDVVLELFYLQYVNTKGVGLFYYYYYYFDKYYYYYYYYRYMTKSQSKNKLIPTNYFFPYGMFVQIFLNKCNILTLWEEFEETKICI